MSKKIKPYSLVAMDSFEADYPLRVDLAYAWPDNRLFGEAIYRNGARLWLYKDLAEIVLAAANLIQKRHGWRLVLYDGLRPVEAQKKMLQTARVKANPQWLEEPRLLSPPGAGAHPRGMAVDLSAENGKGLLIDMGTSFDFLADNPHPAGNPAHRDYPQLSETVRKNRAALETAMREAAEALNTPLLPLPQEWWDFRLPPDIYEQYAPLRDQDLPPQMRMTRA